MPNLTVTLGLCPHTSCLQKLDIQREGWHMCGNCGRALWCVHETKAPSHARQCHAELRRQFFCYTVEIAPQGWPQPPSLVIPLPVARALGRSKYSPEVH